MIVMNNDEKILQLLTQIQSDVTEIKTKVDSVIDQTANLTEFRTETNTKLDIISNDIEFLKHQDYQTKQDLFNIKRNLKLVK